MSHCTVAAASLPFHLYYEETLLAGNLYESRCLGLGARVVGISVEKNHHRDTLLRGTFHKLYRPVFVPEPRQTASLLGHYYLSLDVEGFPVCIRLEFVRAELSVLCSFVMCMLVVVVAEVLSEDLFPCQGKCL